MVIFRVYAYIGLTQGMDIIVGLGISLSHGVAFSFPKCLSLLHKIPFIRLMPNFLA